MVGALQQIFFGHHPADKVIERTFKSNRKWGSRDRRQFAETVYGVVRHWRSLLWLAGIEWPKEDVSPLLEPEGLWRVLAVYGTTKSIEIAGAPKVSLRKGLDDQPRAVQQSFPDWLDNWASVQTDGWDRLSVELNRQAPVFLRANRLKTRAADLLSLLEKRNLKVRLMNGDALCLEERANVFVTEEFSQGLFEVQDIHSQTVAPFLQVQPGQRVIDACAGAGGKTVILVR